jgi:SAM-dependent methyltransferase
MLTIDFRKLSPQSGDLILDAGCGEGRHVFACLNRPCTILGLDLNQHSLLKARYILESLKQKNEIKARYLLIRGDVLRFPFPDEIFDRIICSEVMEHFWDEKPLFAELTRVLKKGGRIAISVPTLVTEYIYGQLSKEYFRTPGGHVRKVIPQALAKAMAAHNLQVYAIGFAHAFHSPYWMLRCLCGLHQEKARVPLLYRKFLLLALFSPPLRFLEKIGNYFLPKSIILYGQKKLDHPGLNSSPVA